jgi:hypothetical protein
MGFTGSSREFMGLKWNLVGFHGLLMESDGIQVTGKNWVYI